MNARKMKSVLIRVEITFTTEIPDDPDFDADFYFNESGCSNNHVEEALRKYPGEDGAPCLCNRARVVVLDALNIDDIILSIYGPRVASGPISVDDIPPRACRRILERAEQFKRPVAPSLRDALEARANA